MRRILTCVLLALSLCAALPGQTRTTVRDVLYNADGSRASGQVQIAWPAFTSADGKSVAAGKLTKRITEGVLDVSLVPTVGATPGGVYYTAGYLLSNGTTYEEKWTVPQSGPVTVSDVRTVSAAATGGNSLPEHQISLGSGLQVLLGFQRASSPPQATGAGQCYWDTGEATVKCSDGAGTNYSRIAANVSGPAGGDLIGTYPNPTLGSTIAGDKTFTAKIAAKAVGSVRYAEQFSWSQTPGGTLTAGAPATVSISCPAGVYAGVVNYPVYISGGTGASEAVALTNTTCVSRGQPGSISFTPANNHGGAWTVQSATGGAAEAYNDALGPGDSCGTIVLPKGTTNIYATWTLYNRFGCRVEGHGRMSSVLQWQGPANGSVVKLYGTQGAHFSHFRIDGGSTAGIGLDITSATPGTYVNTEGTFEDFSVQNVKGTPGYGIHVGGTNFQVSEQRFRNFTVSDTKTCIFQEYGQTVNIRYDEGTCGTYSVDGLHIESGAATTDNMTFLPNHGGVNDVYIGPNAGKMTFRDNYHEIQHDANQRAYYFAGPGRSYQSSISDSYILWMVAGGDAIKYEQEGPLSLDDNTITTLGTPGASTTLNFAGQGPSPNSVRMLGNALFYATVAVSGQSTLMQDRLALTGGSNGLLLNGMTLNVTGARFGFNGYSMTKSAGGALLWQDATDKTFLGVGLGGPDTATQGFSTAFIRSGNVTGCTPGPCSYAAGSGFLRMTNTDAIRFRKAPEQGADLNALSFDANNVTKLGDADGVSLAGPLSGTVADMSTGFRIGGGAANGAFLRGNGANFVAASIAGGDLPNPGAGMKGGVQALTCTGTDKLRAIGSDGIPVCGADQTGGAGGGITTLHGLTAGAQTFSKTDDSNVTLTLGTSGLDTHTFSMGWSGKLSLARGGTNQDSWTASRCVRVNDGGTALEAASADCGAGGGTVRNALDLVDGKPVVGDGGTTGVKTVSALGWMLIDKTGSSLADLATRAYSDLTGKPTLGDAASKNTGTGAGTVAAGDDARFVATGKTPMATDTAVAAEQLPNPAVGAKGGIEARICSGSDKLSAIGTDGVPVCSADQVAGAGGGYSSLAGDSGTATKTGTESIAVLGTAGEIATVAADDTNDKITVSLPATLSTNKSITGQWQITRAATGADDWGLKINAATGGSTNLYGLLINPQTAGATGNWNLWSGPAVTAAMTSTVGTSANNIFSSVNRAGGSTTALAYGETDLAGVYVLANNAVGVSTAAGATTVGGVIGVESDIYATSTGTTSFANAIQGSVNNSSSGTITDAVVLDINSTTNSGGGTIGNVYGVRIADQTGASTGNWAIKTALGRVQFGDIVQLDGNSTSKRQFALTSMGGDPASPVTGDLWNNAGALKWFNGATKTIAFLDSTVATASTLAADPTDCGAGTVATAIAANGNLTCRAVANTDFGTQAANRVLAGPTTGADATPTFRSLVAADIPASLINTTSVNNTEIPAGATLMTTSTGVSTAQMPALSGDITSSAGTVATALASRYKTRTCELHIWGSAANQVLQDGDDEPVSCLNTSGSDWTLIGVTCWANAGAPSVLPILTGGAANSMISGGTPFTCGTASFAAGTLNGSPVVHSATAGGVCSTAPCSIDANVGTAGGTASNIRLVFTFTF